MNSDLMPVPIRPTAVYTKAVLTTSMPFPGDITELSLAMLSMMPLCSTFLLFIFQYYLSEQIKILRGNDTT